MNPKTKTKIAALAFVLATVSLVNAFAQGSYPYNPYNPGFTMPHAPALIGAPPIYRVAPMSPSLDLNHYYRPPGGPVIIMPR